MKNYPEGESGWLFDLMVVILTFLFCLLVLKIADHYFARAERAAYLEGRYDFDRATAWLLAEDLNLNLDR